MNNGPAGPVLPCGPVNADEIVLAETNPVISTISFKLAALFNTIALPLVAVYSEESIVEPLITNVTKPGV